MCWLLPGLTSGSWGPVLRLAESGLLPLDAAEVLTSPSKVSAVKAIFDTSLG